jgi:hypothetical protein
MSGALNLRNLPDGLLFELKMAATKSGVTLKQFCQDALFRSIHAPQVEQAIRPSRPVPEFDEVLGAAE